MRTLIRLLAALLLAVATPASAQYATQPATGTQPGAGTSTPQQKPRTSPPPQSPGIPNPLFPNAPLVQQPPQEQQIPRKPIPVMLAPSGTSAKPGDNGRSFDYSVNVYSDVFGANMFTGAFVASGASIFNPDHVVAVGDQLQVRMWGAFQFDSLLTVDPQGNIFLPQVGPVGVGGVPNKDLQRVLEQSLRRTFRSNVYSYISLATAQPVRVYVTGFVHRPGMYEGTSTDSILRYLDQAGGIDPERGSFLDVQVLRGSQVRGTFNLYEFLIGGRLPGVQLGDGDVILVNPRKSVFKVAGLAENTKRFEFTGSSISLPQLGALARPLPIATHVRVTRNIGVVKNVDYYALSEMKEVQLSNGNEIEFTADQRPGTITVRVEGEHISAQEYVLPYGTRMGELIKRIEFIESSDSSNLQLFRLSVKERQRQLLQASLKNLEAAVLTARAGTSEEARLRTDEAALMMQWVERAKSAEPLGQVVIAQTQKRDELLLENGDIVRVPAKNGLVLVHGEVLFPNAVAFDSRFGIEDYIKRAGGYTQSADTNRIIVAHRDGSFDETPDRDLIRAGDDILVLPKVQSKPRQFWKDIVQIIFQVALAAKVVLDN
jgi:protein involved in polysaccharide export with SLBB domain